ncbi:DUF4373 domain-containing protein [uncultured Bacteroides sp.]|uniref:DUF4373 domain-containing protein n=1 Tax=uncultured Bacteroides sp. TaxID=162156 RepID=UPI002AAB252E|nr:DUF4373 domain-containing protein [uncultured Bacteroides sp.]
MSNNKIGLSYYNIDTDRYQDIKIKRLKKDFGCSGIAVYDYMLCEIYRVKGYFLVWDENTAFDVAEYFGLKETLVKDIVDYCCAVGLFDKELLTSEKILTSSSIQSRYVEMCNRAKRINIKIQEEYSKLTEESAKLREVCPKKEEVCRKVKESKEEKESTKVDKKKNMVAAKAATLSRKDEFYKSLIPYVDKYPKEMIRAFFDYWSEMNKSETKMRFEKQPTWEVGKRLATWANKEIFNGNNKNTSVPKSGKINSDKESGNKPNTDTAGFKELINTVRIG